MELGGAWLSGLLQERLWEEVHGEKGWGFSFRGTEGILVLGILRIGMKLTFSLLVLLVLFSLDAS